MKIITFAVPCYNSAAYMNKCIDSILVAGDKVEIILVNDGSSDETSSICKEYENKYPNIIKAIDQENKGHGGAVNTGISNATGKYFKVVDSDDWLCENSLKSLMATLEECENKQEDVDLFIANYVYENTRDNTSKVINYTGVFPENKVFNWSQCKRFELSQYLLMHSIVYKTELIRKCKLKLPEHTFYVDNIFAYIPLPYVKNIYYLNVDLYRYFIGREDQSVNEAIMVKRVDQQLRITQVMLKAHNLTKLSETEPKLSKYMSNYLAMMVTISSILLIKSDREDSYDLRKQLWKDIKDEDSSLYRKLKYRSIAGLTRLNKKSVIKLYDIARKKYNFN